MTLEDIRNLIGQGDTAGRCVHRKDIYFRNDVCPESHIERNGQDGEWWRKCSIDTQPQAQSHQITRGNASKRFQSHQDKAEVILNEEEEGFKGSKPALTAMSIAKWQCTNSNKHPTNFFDTRTTSLWLFYPRLRHIKVTTGFSGYFGSLGEGREI